MGDDTRWPVLRGSRPAAAGPRIGTAHAVASQTKSVEKVSATRGPYGVAWLSCGVIGGASHTPKPPRSRAIIRAAHDEFVERGFHGATVAAIARRAGVAPQTIYFVFHTKPELISGVIDTAVMGEDDPLPPQGLPWWQDMRDEPDPAEALRVFVRGAAPLFARAATISEVLRAAALTDSEVRGIYEAHEKLRRAGFSEVLNIVAAKGRLRTDCSRDQLLDIFLVTFGDTAYHVYSVELDWPHEAIVDWMCDALPTLLLTPIRRRHHVTG